MGKRAHSVELGLDKKAADQYALTDIECCKVTLFVCFRLFEFDSHFSRQQNEWIGTWLHSHHPSSKRRLAIAQDRYPRHRDSSLVSLHRTPKTHRRCPSTRFTLRRLHRWPPEHLRQRPQRRPHRRLTLRNRAMTAAHCLALTPRIWWEQMVRTTKQSSSFPFQSHSLHRRIRSPFFLTTKQSSISYWRASCKIVFFFSFSFFSSFSFLLLFLKACVI